MARGQITFFIILGVVLLLISSIAFYLSSSSRSSEVSVKESARGLFDSAAVRSYVQSCLGNSMSDGINALGSHGGFILEDESGFFVKYPQLSPMVVNYSNISVAVLIKSTGVYSFASDFFYNGTPARLGKSGLPLVNQGLFSFDSQLSAYVFNKTASCLNFSSFEKDITSTNLSVNVSSNAADVSSVLDADVTVLDVPVSVVKGFVVKRDARLAGLHDFVDDIISRDNSYLDFNLSSDYNKSAYWDTGFNVTVHYSVPNDSFDVIEVVDYGSNIRGAPLKFFFARENRAPVLNYINDSAGRFFSFDSSVDAVAVNPVVYDPDEDNLNVSIRWFRANGDFVSEGLTSPTIAVCGNPCFGNVSVNDSFFSDSQGISFKSY